MDSFFKNFPQVPVNEITKEEFDKVVKVRDEGRYNMVMEGRSAAIAADVDIKHYWTILANFEELYNKFKGE